MWFFRSQVETVEPENAEQRFERLRSERDTGEQEFNEACRRLRSYCEDHPGSPLMYKVGNTIYVQDFAADDERARLLRNVRLTKARRDELWKQWASLGQAIGKIR